MLKLIIGTFVGTFAALAVFGGAWLAWESHRKQSLVMKRIGADVCSRPDPASRRRRYIELSVTYTNTTTERFYGPAAEKGWRLLSKELGCAM